MASWYNYIHDIIMLHSTLLVEHPGCYYYYNDLLLHLYCNIKCHTDTEVVHHTEVVKVLILHCS